MSAPAPHSNPVEPTHPQLPPQPLSGDLRTALGRAHEAATALLADPDGSRLDVVSWLSAHIAAFEHTIYPVARRRLADGKAMLEEDSAVVSRLTHLLRIVERSHSGDVLASNVSQDGLHERLSALVEEHSAIQARIVDAIDQALDPAETASLARDYASALAHAPTRPHPHLHSRLLYRLDALRDHVLDTMDSRHVPFPRMPKAKIIPGRWGSYLLGQPHEPGEEEDLPS